jgi:hypothetical protein
MYIVVYRPVVRQRPRDKQRDNSRCYATARQTIITVGNGVIEPVARQLQ